MKNIKIILGCLFSGVFILSSCKKSFTDIPYYGLQTVQNTGVFQTSAGCINYVTGCYSVINENDWWQTMWYRLNLETATDNGWLGNLGGFSNAASYRAVGSLESITPTAGDVVNLYQFSYLGIGQCNFGIANLATSTIDAQLKTRLTAEMRVL